jgi:RNA polymerase sigma factor (sigma-70 family)
VEESDNTARRDDDEAIASARYPTSARLVAAVLRVDEAAIRELFLLYSPLLRDQARLMNIAPEDRSEFVTTLLDDVVLHLIEHQASPRNLSRYLVASLRNRARNWHRDQRRRLDAREWAYDAPSTSPQRIVAECHSEYGIRASARRTMDSDSTPREPISKLAQRLSRELTREEQVMMIRLGRHVPLREVAEQLGVAYGTARVRLYRLRDRLRKLAIEYTRSLRPDERDELERLFRRAEVILPRAAGAKQREKDYGKV